MSDVSGVAEIVLLKGALTLLAPSNQVINKNTVGHGFLPASDVLPPSSPMVPTFPTPR